MSKIAFLPTPHAKFTEVYTVCSSGEQNVISAQSGFSQDRHMSYVPALLAKRELYRRVQLSS